MTAPELEHMDIDDRDPPFVVFVPKPGVEVAHADSLIFGIRHYIGLGRPFVSVHDARFSRYWKARDREVAFEFLRAERAAVQKVIAAHVTLVPSELARGVVNAIIWGTPFRKRVRTYASLEEAKPWGRRMYEDFVGS